MIESDLKSESVVKKRESKQWSTVLLLLTSVSMFLYFSYDLEYHQMWGRVVLTELIQRRSPLLDLVFHFFTLFGFEFLVAIVPICFWAGSVRMQALGANFLSLIPVTYMWLTIFKLHFKEPRPYWIHSSFVYSNTASVNGEFEYSFPSGPISLKNKLCFIPLPMVMILLKISPYLQNQGIVLRLHFVGKIAHQKGRLPANRNLTKKLFPKQYTG